MVILRATGQRQPRRLPSQPGFIGLTAQRRLSMRLSLHAIRTLNPALTGGAESRLKPVPAFAPSPGRKAGDLSRTVSYGRITSRICEERNGTPWVGL
jgi:hypothetical protein